jgi:hypothetical protein
MYDNPIYRWRESIAVALSELHDPPLSGYLAYRSIRDYLVEHGLALTREAPNLDYQALRRLVYEPDQLEKIFQEASSTSVDYTLTPVSIGGNEKGEAAYYYWAFRIFGIHITSLWYLYFVLLGVSVVAFFAAFWRSTFCTLLLMVYLIGHLYMLDVASASPFQTVHNSRFLPVLALLPSMHLMLLSLRRVAPYFGAMTLAAIQAFLLFFVIFSRLEAVWQLVAVLVVSAMAPPLWKLVRLSWSPNAFPSIVGQIVPNAWPAILVIIGGLGFALYQQVALDRVAYATETRTHTFWDPLLVGTISASDQLTELYGMGEPPYSDTMGYFIARRDVMERNDTTSSIAVVQNGIVIGTFAMNNMGEFDSVLRHVFFQMASAHPWLVLKSFVYDKPLAELQKILVAKDLFHGVIFLCCIVLSLGIGAVLGMLGAQPIMWRPHVRTIGWVTSSAGLLSMSTAFIYPTAYIPDAILVFVLLILLVPACAALSFSRSTIRTVDGGAE